MSFKDDYIAKYGEEAYEKRLVRSRAYHKAHKEEDNARNKKYHEEHPEEEKVRSQEQCRKGGMRYDQKLVYLQTGIPGERHKIRKKHGKIWSEFKRIIAPDSQIHHQWVPNTAEYTGLALVEADAHMHGVIDVIRILEGKITLLTENEVRMGQ